MKTYVARRLLALIPVGLVVATVAFLLMHLAPGNPASIIAGPEATADDVREIEQQLGLDRPLPIQLVDLGSSIFLRKPVTEAILDRVNLVGDGRRDLLDPKIRSLQTDRQRAGGLAGTGLCHKQDCSYNLG